MTDSYPAFSELRAQALEILLLTDADEKARRTHALHAQADALPLHADAQLHAPPAAGLPGMPAALVLARHTDVARRSPATLEGRAVLVHAIVHIEFNAIHLALDAIWRFAGMPPAFYRDWLKVAAEEAKHFQLLQAQLERMGWHYGSFPAHQGLWSMCEKTRHDRLARMALVPRTLEARGLDATPLIQQKLRQIGTDDAVQTVAILDIILREEVGHVAIGNYWYRWLCHQQQLEPVGLYPQLVAQYEAPRPKAPLNLEARRAAGFTEEELAYLQWGGD
ncbi:Uncharacterized conserved protein, contains ferritin-like DUF455 domain [Lampropedia hyalina DSM 16112]|jgi:uncharacterized ferritin-like protein (DUF455 family)|uniref:Uncharacterized conserved protein, contains ferritin-like DUF455 domain n=1 Tax=Lampropedia hyalina DSM 16112 TaxID=1122156 RepID=A0A1M5D1D5_9BURK|nr:ferritin-like domain-containing protein [Lampropedia hyalina]SHF60602.1 Uncharacterized conserved protein, contains ferritin-like DUF455 domain [Lampropedia hyalina DSM 16112]